MSFQFELDLPNNCLTTLQVFGLDVDAKHVFSTHAPYDLSTGALVIGHNRLDNVEKSGAVMGVSYDENGQLSIDIDLDKPTDRLLIVQAKRDELVDIGYSAGRIAVGVSAEFMGMSFIEDTNMAPNTSQGPEIDEYSIGCMVRALVVQATKKIISASNS
ncbi:hypothetical protein KC867_02530 [Candidatus Saccharibacteria bacterium]|nr:hypothetical protein [Candidatus Saccharibacteria bacterium]